MDNRQYASETVRAWCERYHVCPEGRDLAAPCVDLVTVWHKIDQPGRLLWMLCMERLGTPARWNLGLSDLITALEHEDQQTLIQIDERLVFGDLPRWCDFDAIDRPQCDYIRRLIDCPFASDAAPACTATLAADGSVVVGAPAAAPQKPTEAPPHAFKVEVKQDKTGAVRLVAVDGSTFVPLDEATKTINQQRQTIAILRDDGHHSWRLVRWILCGVGFGAAVAVLLANLVQREEASK